jgi:hypothetical protein
MWTSEGGALPGPGIPCWLGLAFNSHHAETGGIVMRRLVIFVLFSILLSYPALSAIAADDTFDQGKTNPIALPFLQFPVGENYGYKTAGDKTTEVDPKAEEKKKNDILDKKVDEAIKKAWEEK